MDSESIPPSYVSMEEYEINMNSNAQNQEDQQEQNNGESDKLIEIPNSVSLIQIIDDDIIEFNTSSSDVECNETIMCFKKKDTYKFYTFKDQFKWSFNYYICGFYFFFFTFLSFMIGLVFWL